MYKYLNGARAFKCLRLQRNASGINREAMYAILRKEIHTYMYTVATCINNNDTYILWYFGVYTG